MSDNDSPIPIRDIGLPGTTSDLELRAMRDAVYGPMPKDQSYEQHNRNWDNCREYWRKDTAWLEAEYAKLKTPAKKDSPPF